jgi:hypothetical protein
MRQVCPLTTDLAHRALVGALAAQRERQRGRDA